MFGKQYVYYWRDYSNGLLSCSTLSIDELDAIDKSFEDWHC